MIWKFADMLEAGILCGTIIINNHQWFGAVEILCSWVF